MLKVTVRLGNGSQEKIQETRRGSTRPLSLNSNRALRLANPPPPSLFFDYCCASQVNEDGYTLHRNCSYSSSRSREGRCTKENL